MKTFDFKTRLINNETLETVGMYEPHKIITSEKGETILLFNRRNKFRIFVTISLILFMFLFTITKQANRNHKLESQIEHYEELTGMNLPYISVEALAGKYATYKGSVPKDKDTIFKFICESGAWYPEVIMAQFQLESVYMTSDIGKNALNGFGMRKCGEGPRSRPNLQIRGMDYHGYGMYMNWYHSILDRVLWDLWVFDEKPASREAYLKGLVNKQYAEDPDYIAKIGKIAEQWGEKVGQYVDPNDPKDTIVGKH